VPRTIRIDEAEGPREAILRNLKAPLRPTVVVIAGSDLGRSGRVEGAFLIGRDPEAHLPLTDPLVSFHHVRLEDQGDGWAAVDMKSTNGVRVNGERTETRVLRANDKIEIGSTVLRFEVRDETDQAYDEAMQRLLHIDDLTGLYMRRRFDEELAAMLRSTGTGGRPLAMLVMDLDGVKAINDANGHLFGAHVIAEAGRVIGRTLPAEAIAARFGGDEFVTAVPGWDRTAGVALGEGILEAIAAHRFEKDGVVLRPGISIGVAAFPESAEDAEALFRAADEALYRAKQAGKGCVRT
jgi:diguanylate cyclase (GGDEF)-like protein